MTALQAPFLVTFGGLAVRGPPGALAQPRRLALAALLAASGEPGLGRDTILSCLWASLAGAQARSALSQAIYALRRDFDREDLILGTSTLRLNRSALPSDVAGFRDALAAGRLAEAADAYAGPFLDGFFLNDAPEFERWAERERARLFGECAAALEQLAIGAATSHDGAGATEFWMRRAAMDLTDGRVIAACMTALKDGGNLQGAMRQSKAHESAMADLGLPADPVVDRLTARMRREPRTTARSRPSSVDAPHRPPLAADPAGDEILPPRSSAGLRIGLGLAMIAAVAALALALPDRPARRTEDVVLAMGDIRGPPAVMEQLAARFARVPGLAVVSTARLHELAALSAPHDTEAWLSAARESGAEHLIDGALVRTETGALRLELRRVNLSAGVTDQASRVEGTEVSALIEESVRRMVEGIDRGSHRRLR